MVVVVVVVVVVVLVVVVVVVTRGSGGVGRCVLTGTSGEPAVQACVSNAIVFNGVSLLCAPILQKQEEWPGDSAHGQQVVQPHLPRQAWRETNS